MLIKTSKNRPKDGPIVRGHQVALNREGLRETLTQDAPDHLKQLMKMPEKLRESMPKNEAERVQARKNAIDWTARNYARHQQKQGDSSASFEKTRPYIEKRAEVVFAKQEEKKK